MFQGTESVPKVVLELQLRFFFRAVCFECRCGMVWLVPAISWLLGNSL